MINNNLTSQMLNDPNKVWLIDLDNTIYDSSHNLMRNIDRKIEEYLVYKCRCTSAEAFTIRQKLFGKYKNTFYGCLNERIILKEEFPEFLEYVHRIEVPKKFNSNRQLISTLRNVKGKKYVFSNGTKSHILRLINELGISNIFEGYLGIEDYGYSFKPNKKPYLIIKNILQKEYKDMILIDDSDDNLKTAISLGILAFNPKNLFNN